MIVLHRPLVAAWLLLCLFAFAACIPADAFAPAPVLPPPPTQVPGEEVRLTPVWRGVFAHPCEGWTEVASLATSAEEYADILTLVSSYEGLPPDGFPSWESLNLGADEAVVSVFIGCTGGCVRDVITKSIVKTGAHALSIIAEHGDMGVDKACPADQPSVADLVRIPWDGTPASETQLSFVTYPGYR